MPYDSSLDKQIFSRTYDTDGGRITVSVWSYNNGPKKLQMTRENMDSAGNLRFTKLGRVSKAEIEGMLPLITQAIQEMK